MLYCIINLEFYLKSHFLPTEAHYNNSKKSIINRLAVGTRHPRLVRAIPLQSSKKKQRKNRFKKINPLCINRAYLAICPFEKSHERKWTIPDDERSDGLGGWFITLGGCGRRDGPPLPTDDPTRSIVQLKAEGNTSPRKYVRFWIGDIKLHSNGPYH